MSKTRDLRGDDNPLPSEGQKSRSAVQSRPSPRSPFRRRTPEKSSHLWKWLAPETTETAGCLSRCSRWSWCWGGICGWWRPPWAVWTGSRWGSGWSRRTRLPGRGSPGGPWWWPASGRGRRPPGLRCTVPEGPAPGPAVPAGKKKITRRLTPTRRSVDAEERRNKKRDLFRNRPSNSFKRSRFRSGPWRKTWRDPTRWPSENPRVY